MQLMWHPRQREGLVYFLQSYTVVKGDGKGKSSGNFNTGYMYSVTWDL